MDKMFNILAMMSVPLCWLVCRAWVRSLELKSRGEIDRESARLRLECADLRQRVETLETIATLPDSPAPRRVSMETGLVRSSRAA